MSDLRLGLFSKRSVPVLLQQESAECGLACLGMVAAYHGYHSDLASLRARVPMSIRGASLADLMPAAAQLRLSARPLRLGLSELRNLQLPAILHWRMDHFVVLVRVRRRHAIIHDPARGRRKLSWHELDESFTGIALELQPVADFARGDARQKISLRNFLTSFQNLGRYLCWLSLLLILTQILALIPAVVTQILIDEVVLGQDRKWLYRTLSGLAAIMVVGVILEALRRWTSLFVTTRLAAQSGTNVLRHLLSLPGEFFHNRHVGDIQSKLESMTPIRIAITDSAVSGLVSLFVVLSTLLVMTLYSPWLTVISFGGFLLSSSISWLFLPASRRLTEEALIHQARQNTSILETLRGIDAVKALDLAPVRLTMWQNHFFAATNARVRQGKLAIVSNLGVGLVGSAEQLIFLAAGISGILDKQLSLGVLFAFMSLRSRFATAASSCAAIARSFFMLRVHMQRLGDIVQTAPQAEPPRGAISRTPRGDIRAQGLCFRYASNQAWVVRGFNCHIEAGESVVISGPSGCGKSTLLHLLAGLTPAQRGHLLIDNVDLSVWHGAALRKHSSIVLQHDRLFRGSIAENISGFDTAPDLGRVRDAAQAAWVWDEIMAMPMTFSTLVGDMGSSLSGGQKQRIILARALYRNPAMLFLDEATSHLDVVAEQRVLEVLSDLKITIVSVAHRPEALKAAGRMIDLGAHAQTQRQLKRAEAGPQ